ncbi:MAG: hypothetical protein LCI00_05625 [Chloroflexi bacterium]|nr:hypothetical protein [Chloroflexota bacterium]
MSKAKFDAAKELIDEKRYGEARALLKTIDHPTAITWLDKLDVIAPAPQIPASKIRTKPTRLQTVLLVIGLLIIGLFVLALMQQRQMAHQGLQDLINR